MPDKITTSTTASPSQSSARSCVSGVGPSDSGRLRGTGGPSSSCSLLCVDGPPAPVFDSTSHARESAYRAALEAQLALAESWYRRVLGIEHLLEHSAPVAAHGSVRRLLDGMRGTVRSLRQTLAVIDGGAHDEVQP